MTRSTTPSAQCTHTNTRVCSPLCFWLSTTSPTSSRGYLQVERAVCVRQRHLDLSTCSVPVSQKRTPNSTCTQQGATRHVHAVCLSRLDTRQCEFTHSCIDDSEMDPCHTESHSELSDRVPGIRHREGGRSEASEGAGIKSAEGNKHAEGQATGPVEPRRDPEGEGNQERTAREQDGQAGRHAIALKARNIPSISQPGVRRIFAKAPSVEGPQGQAREKLGALFEQSLPCWPWV